MKLTHNPFRRNAAVLAVAAVLAALGIGGVAAAQADTTASHSQVQHTSDGDGEQNDATEVDNGAESDGEVNDDATDTGPDANLNEPGHQDASDYR